ncbi:MAG: penicillin-binding protein 2 [Bacteroidetes bacterium]|nr:penicillin-binding protein 2 [Bacteroidota bacterium]MDA1332703.1 penicillin-binding protein 2 [Bacteroidota bacterium]
MDEGRSRLRIFAALIAVVLGILFLRLGKLQIIERSDHTGKSTANAVRERRVQPPRGRFYDRNGVLLVENEPSFTLYVTPRYFDPTTIPLLSSLVMVPDSVIQQRFDLANKAPFQRSPLQPHITFEALSRVLEQRHNLPGVDYDISQKRRYLTDARLTHALGYVREISETALEKHREEGYIRGDPFGQGGLELQYEQDVRGTPGSEFKMINIKGQVVADYLEGQENRAAQSGMDLTLTIDADLQAFAESLFVNKRGGVIAIDPSNGEVLAMHSAPDFDLEMFTERLDPAEWDSIRTHPDRPLFNRVTQSVLAPGSTFKPLVAMLALEQGVINRNSRYFCGGGHPIGRGNFFNCLAEHGSINVIEALEVSCNTFFFEMMNRIDVNSLNEIASRFGFGREPWLDIDSSSIERGLIPDSSYYNRIYGTVAERNRGLKVGWTQGNVMNLGVGQGEVNVSLLQLSRYIAAMANGGRLVTPHLVRGLIDPQTGEERIPAAPPSTQLEVNPVYLDIVKEGMKKVVHDHSWWLDIPGIPSMGKTGSAQNNRDEDNSWFIFAAPADNPKIAVAVLAENAGFGSNTAGPIGSFIAERYLKGTLELTPTRRDKLKTLMALNTITEINPGRGE